MIPGIRRIVSQVRLPLHDSVRRSGFSRCPAGGRVPSSAHPQRTPR
ncbi:hypothetical protein HMPREF3150_02253 [Pseudomonas aeruginosa]|nr:hypothetical protein HMPREF3150_02253 [Pseudomonas aeruginosa]